MDQKERMTVREFIGEEVCRDHTFSYPVLRLLVERVASGIEDEKRLYGLFFANNGPDFNKYGSLRMWLEYITRLPAYLLNRLTRKSHTPDTILVSDTILMSDRYAYFQQECLKNDRITGLSMIFNHYSLTGHRKKYNRYVSLGKYIVGPEIFRKLTKIFNLVRKAYGGKCACTLISGYTDEVKELDELLKVCVERIKKELIRNNVCQYITCNQYRIEEVVIIEACRELGIITKEWSHHSMCSFDIHIFETPDDCFISDLESLYIFTDRYCVWSEGDSLWITRYGHIDPVFGQEVTYPAVGSPELNKEMIADIAGDGELDHICYLVLTHYDDGRRDKEIYEAHYRVLDELNKFSQRTGLKVYVRYHPSEYASRTDKEMEIYDRYGFELLDTSREALENMYKNSKACISSGTSALILSYNYGIPTYSVEVEAKGTFDYSGTPIRQIEIEDIADLDIDGCDMKPMVDAMNTEKLFKV